MKRKSECLATMLAISLAMNAPETPSKTYRKGKPEKQCLNCGKTHTHNNSFCSPKCCKEWKK